MIVRPLTQINEILYDTAKQVVDETNNLTIDKTIILSDNQSKIFENFDTKAYRISLLRAYTCIYLGYEGKVEDLLPRIVKVDATKEKYLENVYFERPAIEFLADKTGKFITVRMPGDSIIQEYYTPGSSKIIQSKSRIEVVNKDHIYYKVLKPELKR